MTAEEIAIDLALRPNLPLDERVRRVAIRQLAVQQPPRSDKPDDEPDAWAGWPFPGLTTLRPFPLTLEQADILGLRVARLDAMISLAAPRVLADEVSILWPDPARRMTVKGRATLDFDARLVTGQAAGQAFPENIMPILVATRARGAIRQINAFSRLERPVDADAQFAVDLVNSDYTLRLALDVGPCVYQGVPMAEAHGLLFATGTNIYNTVVIDPLRAREADGGTLVGALEYRDRPERVTIHATADMDPHRLAQILQILHRGQLKHLRFDTPARIAARGLIAIDSRCVIATNALDMELTLERGAFFNLPFTDVSSSVRIEGHTAHFSNLRGLSPNGGSVSGDLQFIFPNYNATNTTFAAQATVANADLTEFARAFNFTNDLAGAISGSFRLAGQIHPRTLPTLAGTGQLAIQDGHLHRLPLFAGFTDYLARNIPGVATLVNQSTASMDFEITNGVLRTENLLIEGDLFSMQGRGTCRLDTQELDFLIRANIFRERTFAGRITRLLTLPFSRLLLEFRVLGNLSAPEWSYVTIIEKLTDGLTELSSPFRGRTEKEPDASPAKKDQP